MRLEEDDEYVQWVKFTHEKLVLGESHGVAQVMYGVGHSVGEVENIARLLGLCFSALKIGIDLLFCILSTDILICILYQHQHCQPCTWTKLRMEEP